MAQQQVLKNFDTKFMFIDRHKYDTVFTPTLESREWLKMKKDMLDALYKHRKEKVNTPDYQVFYSGYSLVDHIDINNQIEVLSKFGELEKDNILFYYFAFSTQYYFKELWFESGGMLEFSYDFWSFLEEGNEKIEYIEDFTEKFIPFSQYNDVYEEHFYMLSQELIESLIIKLNKVEISKIKNKTVLMEIDLFKNALILAKANSLCILICK